MRLLTHCSIGVILMLQACTPQTKNQATFLKERENEVIPIIKVGVTPITKAALPVRMITNGKVTAEKEITITSQIAGIIKLSNLSEGKQVSQNDVLVKLDDKEQQLELAGRQLELKEKAIIRDDLLVSNGGVAGIDSSVSEQKMENIMTLSGFEKAKHNVKIAENELGKTFIYAPFSGILADVRVKQFQHIGLGEFICKLIDPSTFQVEFSLLEVESSKVAKGQRVKIQPVTYPEKELSGIINSIQPLVSTDGLVKISCLIEAGQHLLFTGMNVKVIIEKEINKQLIVPKSAIVLRSNRTVVFTFNEKEAKAKWHFVDIVQQNDVDVAITGDIRPGELVITEGHLNIDHDTPVQLSQ